MSRRGQRLTHLELLERLVSFDTESSKPNLALMDVVCDYLEGWDVPFVRVPNAAGDKAAVFATIGPMVGGGIVLSGHTDVVPVAGQAWTTDPFALRIADGRAYGRGAVDMKGFCALALAAVPDALAADLRRPIHILLSYDEETTCLGVADTIARFGADLPRPGAVIVGEPTGMEVADAHKSIVTYHTTVHGHEAHSAKPMLGANAVMAAADLVSELNRIADAMIARGDASGRFDPPAIFRDDAGTMLNTVPGFLPNTGDFPQMFKIKLRDWIDACTTGSEQTAPAEAGLAVQKILDGVYRSAESGGKEVVIK